jgi:hypothetical protein
MFLNVIFQEFYPKQIPKNNELREKLGYQIELPSSQLSRALTSEIKLYRSDVELMQNYANKLNFENEETEFGTKEKKQFNAENINNVDDACDALTFLINLEKIKKMNEIQYSKLEKIGDLHIYDDGRPMEFNKI